MDQKPQEPQQHRSRIAELFESIKEMSEVFYKIQQRNERRKRIFTRVSLVFLAFIFFFGTVVGIPFLMAHRRNQWHQEMHEMVDHFDLKHVFRFGEVLDRLPYDYRDVEPYRDEYKEIMESILIIEKGAFYRFTDDRRAAYDVLQIYNLQNERWNLEPYLQSMDNRLQYLNILWTNEDFEFIYFFDEVSHDYILQTTLLNEKHIAKEYVLYLSRNKMAFGTVNRYNYMESFWMYRIDYVDRERIEIYCYADDSTHTLTRQEIWEPYSD